LQQHYKVHGAPIGGRVLLQTVIFFELLGLLLAAAVLPVIVVVFFTLSTIPKFRADPGTIAKSPPSRSFSSSSGCTGNRNYSARAH
jgi:tellurite resistance protein TehA-like permease